MALRRKSMYGLETELFTLDSEGKLVPGAADIIKKVEGTKLEKYVRKEIARSMLELGAKEKRTVAESAYEFLGNLEEVIEVANDLGYRLLPLSAHPGKARPKLSISNWYNAKKAVLGQNTYKEASICGFHFHYTLPEGIVHKSTETIKKVGRSKARDIFIQQYNFMASCDPAILTFCQSSPFWEGVHWGKDCRVLVYRDLKVTKADKEFKGIHYYLPMFGRLPSYEFTLEDIRVMADMKKAEWLRLLEQKNFPTNEIACFPTLKFMWGPLRVNKIGTLEYRGPDMTHPDVIFSSSSLLVYLLRRIEKLELMVEPSDVGIEEPFVLEDDTIYVPPYATLRHLEQQSVTRGFESKAVHDYCSALLNLAEKLPNKAKNLDRVKEMVDKKKTVSDEILDMVKKNGYDLEEQVPDDMMNHIALYHADRLASDIGKVRKSFKKRR
jgi:carboxylate-amine ligase